jgi:hypothetical protein
VNTLYLHIAARMVSVYNLTYLRAQAGDSALPLWVDSSVHLVSFRKCILHTIVEPYRSFCAYMSRIMEIAADYALQGKHNHGIPVAKADLFADSDETPKTQFGDDVEARDFMHFTTKF